MKKKIKDLTFEEIISIHNLSFCNQCPLKDNNGDCIRTGITYDFSKEFLEKEIEIVGTSLFECIKEWGEKGWELSDIHKHLDLGTNYYFLEKDMPHRNLNININYKQIRCSDSNGDAEELELDELELAIKTLKALEVKDENR